MLKLFHLTNLCIKNNLNVYGYNNEVRRQYKTDIGVVMSNVYLNVLW